MSYTLLIWISNGLYSITDIQLFYKIYKESVFMIIEARELSKIYGSGESRVVALDKADLKIGQGDFLSITGLSLIHI